MKNPINNSEIMDDINTDDLFIESDMREVDIQDAIQEEACLDLECEFYNRQIELGAITGLFPGEDIW